MSALVRWQVAAESSPSLLLVTSGGWQKGVKRARKVECGAWTAARMSRRFLTRTSDDGDNEEEEEEGSILGGRRP